MESDPFCFVDSGMPKSFRHRNLALLLLQSRESVMRQFRPNLKAHGLTEQQWRVLRALDEEGPVTIGRLAEACCILGPSMSGMLARMESADLIRRRRAGADQRAIRVELTRHGRTVIGAMSGSVEQIYLEIEQTYGPEHLASLYELLERLVALPGPGDEHHEPAQPI